MANSGAPPAPATPAASSESRGRVACIAIVAADVSDTVHATATSPSSTSFPHPGELSNHPPTHPQNAPLYLRIFPSSGCDLDAHQLQEVMYNSLDVVEERTSTSGNSSTRRGGGSAAASAAADLGGFVGCLAVVGPLSVFGCVTATRRKVLLAVAGGEAEPKDARVRAVFRRIVAALANRAADPFAKLDAALGGPRFETAVKDAVAWFG